MISWFRKKEKVEDNTPQIVAILKEESRYVPKQDSVRDVLVTTVLIKYDNGMYSCKKGVGDSHWVANRGQELDHEEASLYWSIDPYKYLRLVPSLD